MAHHLDGRSGRWYRKEHQLVLVVGVSLALKPDESVTRVVLLKACVPKLSTMKRRRARRRNFAYLSFRPALREQWFTFGEDAVVLGANYAGSSELDFFLDHPATSPERDWQAIKKEARSPSTRDGLLTLLDGACGEAYAFCSHCSEETEPPYAAPEQEASMTSPGRSLKLRIVVGGVVLFQADGTARLANLCGLK